MKTLKTRLKYFREIIGISQLELSQKSNVSQASIARIESGKQQNLKRETIKKLADGLGVSLTQLMESPSIVKEERAPYNATRDLPVVALKEVKYSENIQQLRRRAVKHEPSFSSDRNAFYLLINTELINDPVIDEGDMILIEPTANVKEKDLVLYLSAGNKGIGKIYYRHNNLIIMPLDRHLSPLIFKKIERRKSLIKIFRISEIIKL